MSNCFFCKDLTDPRLEGGGKNWCLPEWKPCKVEGCQFYTPPLGKVLADIRAGEPKEPVRTTTIITDLSKTFTK